MGYANEIKTKFTKPSMNGDGGFMPEFNKGNLVTFNAYKGEVIPARVVEYLGVDSVSGLHKYRLEGTEKSKPLQTITSGSSIRESIFFVEPKEFVW